MQARGIVEVSSRLWQLLELSTELESLMNVALWMVQGLLAVLLLMAGVAKLTQPREKMLARAAWVEDFTDGPLKTIGGLEVLAAIGLILPGVTGIAPVLVPIAASGIILLLIGAVVVHTRRSEISNIAANLVIIAMAAFVAWERLGDYAL